jgi:ABC-2 type transport system permease protein
MLLGIIGFEWRYVTRRITFAATAAVFALLGFVLAATGFGAQDIHVNSPYAVAYATAFLSLSSVFALTVLVAPSLLRDTEHQMGEIVYATSVTKTQYLVGRLVGSFLAVCTAFAFGIGGMMAGLLRHEPERIAAFDLGSYLGAFAVLALPSMAFVAALLFTLAALTRSTLATYVGGVGVYVLYFVAALLTNSPLMAASGPVSAQEMAVAALVDPFGLSAFFEQTHHWTAAERDVRSVSLTGNLLLNRVLWTTAAVLLVALAHRLFAFRVPGSGRRAPAPAPLPSEQGDAYRPAQVHAGTAWPAVLSAIRLEFRALLRSWPFLAILILWVGTAGIQIFENVRRAEFGSALLPTTGLILRHLDRPLLLFGLLVIVFFSGELVWRERTVRVAEIVDTTPASNALFFVSKALALLLLVGVLIAVAIGVGVTVQVASGYRPIEPGLHASLFYFGGLPLALFAVLALLIQTLAPNRYAGMLATLVAALLLPLGAPGSPDHPLLRYAAGGTVQYSEMNGFGPTAVLFTALMAYWTAFAGLLAFLTYGAWRRGSDTRLLLRLRALPRRWGTWARVAVSGCAVAFVLTGSALFHQLTLLNSYETAEDRAAWKATYERTYKAIEALPHPELTHLTAALDLHPEERRYRLYGRYQLENRTSAPITSFWAIVPRGVRIAALTVDGRPPVRVDARFSMHEFDVPLAPGARVELAFDLAVERRGATSDVEHDILDNGSFIMGPSVLPTLGYRRGYELTDEAERRRQGLPERTVPPVQEPDLTTFELTVSTPGDQLAVAPGIVRETWEKDGRRLTRFSVDHPVQPLFVVSAARYTVTRARHGSIDIEVLHHPAHGANVGRILEAATRTLEYCTTQFGPYPFPQLRIAEVPGYDGRFGALALPGVVYFTEDRGFLTDLRDEGRIDIVTKRTAHEVAHQWWGHQVIPPGAPGSSAIVETLARYSELMVLKERYGEASLRPVLQVELGKYLSGRTGEEEVPLDRVEEQAWLSYAKGALVMTALQELIGEARVNGALRALVEQAKSGGPAPTARDLIEHLRRATPAEHHALLDEWWSQTVLYDLSVTSATATRLPDGRYRVDAKLDATKAAVREGQETALAMDDSLEVAIYAEYPNGSATSPPPLATIRHVISGPTELSLIVDRLPGYIAIDPRLRRIDRNPNDNVRKLEEPPAPRLAQELRPR